MMGAQKSMTTVMLSGRVRADLMVAQIMRSFIMTEVLSPSWTTTYIMILIHRSMPAVMSSGMAKAIQMVVQILRSIIVTEQGLPN
jgi:hypothetical protein